MNLTRRAMLAAGLSAIATNGWAAPRPYQLIADKSVVSFQFNVNGSKQTGTVPVQNARVSVDTANLSRSSADVTADIRKARTGLVFVTQALLSQDVLDAANHPIVQFTSTAIRLGAQGRISEGAIVEGRLTLRGVALPIKLDAQLSRPPGTAANDLSTLYIRLNGIISRSTFGATGYAKLVDDDVLLDIRAEISTQG